MLASMPRVDAIWANPLFQENLATIEAAETQRVYCRHGLSHLLDVARTAWIINLEGGFGLARDVVYAAALLHDIGRAAEYSEGISHDVAGVEIARRILGTVVAEQRFSSAEAEAIVKAVRGHRADDVDPVSCELSSLSSRLACVIAEADHRSRPCFACSACATCYWPEEKKNMAVRV